MPMALYLFDLMIKDHQWQVQSQAHDQGVQLERHEEGDEGGGGQKACKNPPEMALKLFDLFDLVMTTKPPEFLETYSEPFSWFHDFLMEMEFKLEVHPLPLHLLPPGY